MRWECQLRVEQNRDGAFVAYADQHIVATAYSSSVFRDAVLAWFNEQMRKESVKHAASLGPWSLASFPAPPGLSETDAPASDEDPEKK